MKPLKFSEMNHKQALLAALALALTAPTDKESKIIGDLADQIAWGMPDEDVEACKEAAIAVRVIACEMHWALANICDKSMAALERIAGARHIKNDSPEEMAHFGFPTQKSRDVFVASISGSRVLSEFDAIDFFTRRFQQKIKASA